MFSITIIYAGILALMLVALSAYVVAGRVKNRVSLGDGGNEDMTVRIRAHANFAEHVPLALIAMGLLETRGTAGWVLHLMGIVLVLSRLAHPIGLRRPPPNPLRGGAVVGTWLVLAAGGVLLILSAAFGFKV